MEKQLNEKVSGEICVADSGTVSVDLPLAQAPKAMVVVFKPKHHHHHHHHPCNPIPVEDSLDWKLEVDESHNHKLVINYQIMTEGVREIIWEAIY